MKKPRPDEEPLDSCKAIADFIERSDYGAINDAVRRALLDDLFFKARGVQTSDKAALLARGMYQCLPNDFRKRFSADDLSLKKLNDLPKQPRKDVGIITVLDTELKAVVQAFDITEDSRLDTQPFKYWFGDLERTDGSLLSLVISQVGKTRNVPCAIAVDHMLSRFSVRLMMLIGIAAGPKGEVKIGDVVSADRVYDYEHVRAELKQGRKKERPRPLVIETPHNIQVDLGTYEHRETSAKLKTLLGKVDSTLLPYPNLRPEFHRGTIAAGERLFADGSLDKMLKSDERVRAGDQEDSGFAQACDFRKIPWCIFRGICDYGDPKKNKRWHFAASLVAAVSAYVFLEQAYQVSGETDA